MSLLSFAWNSFHTSPYYIKAESLSGSPTTQSSTPLHLSSQSASIGMAWSPLTSDLYAASSTLAFGIPHAAASSRPAQTISPGISLISSPQSRTIPSYSYSGFWNCLIGSIQYAKKRLRPMQYFRCIPHHSLSWPEFRPLETNTSALHPLPPDYSWSPKPCPKLAPKRFQNRRQQRIEVPCITNAANKS